MKKQRATLLSTTQAWISLEIILLFFLEIVYAIIFWRHESAKDQATMEAVIATARNISVCILPTIVGIVGMFEIGGEIMIRFTRLMQEAIAEGIAQGIAQGKAEGRAEGRAEVYRVWHADWERRRQAAAEKGIPFDEPPPPKPEDITED